MYLACDGLRRSAGLEPASCWFFIGDEVIVSPLNRSPALISVDMPTRLVHFHSWVMTPTKYEQQESNL